MNVYRPEGTRINTDENNRMLQSISSLREAMQAQKILEARAVVCDSGHNLIVDLGCCKGVIPREETAIGIAEGVTRNIAIISRVGKPVSFMVTEIQGDECTALLSRRKLQERCQKEYLSRLSLGDIIPVRATHLETFGCFVDVGCGIVSLIPIDSISVSRISHPKDRFASGQDLLAVVRQIDQNGRITLSHKELLGTWEENAARFFSGETVTGVIRSVEHYGAFVELAPNLAGLAEPKETVEVGQHASVYIKNMIPERMKVKLIIVDTFENAAPPPPPDYFITGTRINSWRYSPDVCERVIETVFE
jgi:small subunit ribosomal protein S1